MAFSSPEASWRFYLSSATAWEAIYADCAAATRAIKLEQYIFENDEVGRRFMSLFVAKAKQGVAVRLLCDRIGSASFSGSPLLQELRDNGGVFRFYNPPRLLDWLTPKRLFPRTHIKALVIDSGIAYVGGVCFAERMAEWRDTQLRVTGPVVGDIERALDRNAAAAVRRERAAPQKKEAGGFTYIQNEPGFLRHPIYRTLLRNIGAAHRCVYIAAAYFIPPRRLRRYLRHAARRGADVVILVPEHSDFPLADWVSLSYAPRLMKDGVRLFLYRHTNMHAKTVYVDGDWGTVGSCNMDTLSLFRNREANLVIEDKDALRQMHDDFMRDLGHARELTQEMLHDIPLWKRAAAHFGRLLRPFL